MSKKTPKEKNEKTILRKLELQDIFLEKQGESYFLEYFEKKHEQIEK